MLEGSPIKSIILFALPIMASSMLQYNYSLVDNIIVGRYVSEYALAAVGSVGPINSFIIGAALGLTTGFTIPVSHAYGEELHDFNVQCHQASPARSIHLHGRIHLQKMHP